MTATSRRPRRTTRGLKYNDAAHRYWLDGRPIPGVTTILGVLDKPALPRWSAREVAEYVTDNPGTIDELRSLGRDSMIDALRGIPWGKRDKAATRGSTIHEHAETILRGDEIELDNNDPLIPVIENALDFLDDWNIRPILVEFPCASREHWWAGTGDLIATYTHPNTDQTGTAIWDWKSGKAIYPEAAMQLNAYAHAEFHGLNGEEQPIPTVDAAFGVHLRADGYDVIPLQFGPDIYAEFADIRRTYDIAQRMRGDWKRPGSGYTGLPIHKEYAS